MNLQRAYDDWAPFYDKNKNLTRDLDAEAVREELWEMECDTLLELGCGTGKNTGFFCQIAKRVIAMDFSIQMLKIARKKVSYPSVQFILADIRHPWPVIKNSVDLISCNLVLEHIPDLNPIFSQAFKVLKLKGKFFICELHPSRQYLGTKEVFHDGDTITSMETYVHHMSDFVDAAERNGFQFIRLKEWWHEKDKDKPPRLISLLFQK